jgi:hypothetical protein
MLFCLGFAMGQRDAANDTNTEVTDEALESFLNGG